MANKLRQQEAGGSLMRVGGLWTDRDKNGNPLMRGNLNAVVRILIFRNTLKEPGSTDPDYILYLAQKERKPEGGDAFEGTEGEPFFD